MKPKPLKIGRKRMGRPRLNPEVARTNRIVTFVTNREMVELERIAEREGRSLSAAVHQILSKFLTATLHREYL